MEADEPNKKRKRGKKYYHVCENEQRNLMCRCKIHTIFKQNYLDLKKK